MNLATKIEKTEFDTEPYEANIGEHVIGYYDTEENAQKAIKQVLYDLSHPPVWSWSANAYLPQKGTRQAEVHRDIASLIYQLNELEPDLKNESELEDLLEQLKAIDADNGRRIFDSA